MTSRLVELTYDELRQIELALASRLEYINRKQRARPGPYDAHHLKVSAEAETKIIDAAGEIYREICPDATT